MPNKNILTKIFISLLGLLLMKGVAFSATIYLSNTLAPDNFTLISKHYLIAILTSSVFIGFINQYFSVRGYRSFNSFLIFFIASSLFSFALMVAVSLLREIDISFLSVFFYLIYSVSINSFAFLSSLGRGQISLKVIPICLLLALIIILFLAGKDSTYFLFLFAIAPIAYLLSFLGLFRTKHNRVAVFSNEAIKEKSSVLFPLFFVLVGTPIQLAFLAVIDGNKNPHEVAIFNICLQLVMLISLIPTCLNYVSLRFISQRPNIRRLKRLLNYLLPALLVMPLIAFPELIVQLYGATFIQNSGILQIYLLVALVSIVYHTEINILISQSSYRIAYIMAGSYALICIIALFLFSTLDSVRSVGLLMLSAYALSTLSGLVLMPIVSNSRKEER